MQQHVGLIKNFISEGTIEKRRFTTFGAAEGKVKRAGVGDPILATTAILGTDGADQRVDVCMDNIREVVFGGTVEFGDNLTSDAEGRAIKAEPAAGANVPIAGRAMSAGVLGVIGHVHLTPSVMQG